LDENSEEIWMKRKNKIAVAEESEVLRKKLKLT
jgi:hypothetical protein